MIIGEPFLITVFLKQQNFYYEKMTNAINYPGTFITPLSMIAILAWRKTGVGIKKATVLFDAAVNVQ